MCAITDFQLSVGDNGIDLCVRAEVCPSPRRRRSKLSSPIGQLLFDNLRRLAGREPAAENPELHKELDKSLFLNTVKVSTYFSML